MTQRCNSMNQGVAFVCRLCTCRTLLPGYHRLLRQVVERLEVIDFFVVRLSLKHPSCRTIQRRRSGGQWKRQAFSQSMTVFGLRTSLMLIFVTTCTLMDKLIEIQGIQWAFNLNTIILLVLLPYSYCSFVFFSTFYQNQHNV